jgi:very-short-patch-repair endonuclease
MNNNPTVIRARALRQSANPAEQSLWYVLKGKQCGGYKFTRQFPIGPYFADFACRSERLLIELDGSQHIDNDYDSVRDSFVLAEGYSVLRFPSSSVLRNREAVCDAILAAVEGRMDSSIKSLDMSFQKSSALPRKFTRHRPWASTHP